VELPSVIPLFPLPNVVLFPGVDLPLHIFEPRYREMVEHAMSGDRLIGMCLLRGDWQSRYYGQPEIFRLGCVGRIAAFAPLADGRSNLVLRGVCRFEVAEEIGGHSYRLARVEWRPEAEVGGPLARREELLASVRRFSEAGSSPWPADVWSRLPEEPDRLVNLLAFGLPLEAVEKMALLECSGTGARAERLSAILDFRLAEQASPVSGVGRDGRRH
jgi:Lon protease-like protein